MESAVLSSPGNFMLMNQPNPMFNQRFMNHLPLGMMNMNPMGGISVINSMGSGMDSLFNVGTMGNTNAMRFGMGSIGNLGIIPAIAPPIMRPQAHAMGFSMNKSFGRMGGVSTIGPSRTTRGQHSFHPYTR